MGLLSIEDQFSFYVDFSLSRSHMCTLTPRFGRARITPILSASPKLVNIAIHMVCIPTIFFTSLILAHGLNSTAFASFDVPLPTALGLGSLLPLDVTVSFIVALGYASYFVLLEPMAGLLYAPILLVMGHMSNVVYEASPDAMKVAGYFFTGAWIAQFIGHGKVSTILLKDGLQLSSQASSNHSSSLRSSLLHPCVLVLPAQPPQLTFYLIVTHGATTPIDVVKTRIQIDPAFKKVGMLKAGRSIVAAEGTAGLLTGFGPTAVGYLAQGGAKFAGYEFWKKTLVDLSGGPEAAIPHRTAIYLAGASIAEFFADVLLTPLEAVRIRLVSDRTYASGLVPGFLRMSREGGLRELYAGFIPIVCKQVPYAVGQFTVNEWAHEVVYQQMSKETRENLSGLQETGVTLGCGVTAGFAAAILSQPADTLLSKINQGKGGSGGVVSRLATLARETGPVGLFSGLGPRMLMTAFLVSGQFFLYKIIKTELGATNGVDIKKD
ncbi:hypothetical protein P7C70_g2749, partial [Phenoliferia sp. Uapishka_3]